MDNGEFEHRSKDLGVSSCWGPRPLRSFSRFAARQDVGASGVQAWRYIPLLRIGVALLRVCDLSPSTGPAKQPSKTKNQVSLEESGLRA